MKISKKTVETLSNIRSNGGIDINHMTNSAKQEGVSLFDYLKDWVKSNYNVNGHTARSVAQYLIY